MAYAVSTCCCRAECELVHSQGGREGQQMGHISPHCSSPVGGRQEQLGKGWQDLSGCVLHHQLPGCHCLHRCLAPADHKLKLALLRML